MDTSISQMEQFVPRDLLYKSLIFQLQITHAAQKTLETKGLSLF
jgi:hypothetical protein